MMRRPRPYQHSRAARRPPAPASRRPARKPLAGAPAFAPGTADKVPLLLFSYDVRRQQLLHCNRHCEIVLGYSRQELLDLGPALAPRLLHSSSLSQVREGSPTALLANDQALTWDCRVRHRNGSWRWLRIRVRASLFGPAGEAQQLVGSAEDVTSYRTAVQELRRQRYLLRQVVDIVPSLIYIFDLQAGRSVYVNRRSEHLLGYTEQELLGLEDILARLLPPEEARRFQQHLAEVAALPDGAALSLEYAVHHRDGSLRWMHATHTPFERDAEGRVVSVIGSAEDITRRRAADERSRANTERLAEQHRLLRKVIDAIPHPVYLKDGNGNYLLANQATGDLYGLLPCELVENGAAALPSTARPDLERFLAQDRQVLATHQDLAIEEPYTLPSGEVLWFHSVKRLFVRADGTKQVLGVDSNITELKRTQLALEAAKEAAEANARAKQDFLANMSHEIRTPLHGIIGLTEVLAQTSLSSAQLDYLQLLGDSAGHLLTVLNDVLTTARLGAGRLEPEARPFKLRELLQSCAALLQPNAQEKGLTLETECPELPVLLGDAHRLRQVLLNLVSNAIKFTREGQVVLRCEPRPAPAAEPADGRVWLQFSVTDTGIGIAPGALSAIFEPFMQAAASTNREYGGSGLGLSISQGLVALLGGQLTVSSEVGTGSTFAFTIPFRPAPVPEPVEPAPASEPAAVPAGRVLLVEDNPVNSLLAETVLRNQGWQVTVAMSGTAAVQLFGQRDFDLVLMDIQMPGMDGETAAGLLRQHPVAARAATPIVALTARAQPGEAARLVAKGFSGYLAKPFREEQLLAVIRTALTTHAAGPHPADPLSSAMPSTEPLYDLGNVRQLVRNDEAVVRRLAWAFIETAPAILTALDEALTQANWEALSDAAHHLKSSLDGLGVERLRFTIRKLEDVGLAPAEPALVAGLVAEVRAVTEQVMAGLRTEFPEK